MSSGSLLSRFFAVLLCLVCLFALAGYQVTGRTAGPRLLGRLGASLVELDSWLPAHQQDLELLAQGRAQNRVQMPDLPFDVTLPAVLVAGSELPDLRARIVRVIGQDLYERGNAAFLDEQGRSMSLSAGEPLRWSVSLLNSRAHRFWRAALVVSFLALLAVLGLVVVSGHSPFAPLAVGGAIAALASLGVWLLAAAAGGLFHAGVDKEIALVVRDGAWLGARNALAVTAASGVLMVLGSLLGGSRRGAWRESVSTHHLP